MRETALWTRAWLFIFFAYPALTMKKISSKGSPDAFLDPHNPARNSLKA
jgi:hypothetical protein